MFNLRWDRQWYCTVSHHALWAVRCCLELMLYIISYCDHFTLPAITDPKSHWTLDGCHFPSTITTWLQLASSGYRKPYFVIHCKGGYQGLFIIIRLLPICHLHQIRFHKILEVSKLGVKAMLGIRVKSQWWIKYQGMRRGWIQDFLGEGASQAEMTDVQNRRSLLKN